MHKRGITRCWVRVSTPTQASLSMQDGGSAADAPSQTELLSAEWRTIVVVVAAGVLALVVATVARVVVVTRARVGVWVAACITAVVPCSVGKGYATTDASARKEA